MNEIFEIAGQISNPLALAGFVAALFFLAIRTMLKAGIFKSISSRSSALIIRRIVDWFFVVTLVATILGLSIHLIGVLANPQGGHKDGSGSVNRSANDEFRNLVFLSAHELRLSREYFYEISKYTHNKTDIAPVGKPTLKNTTKLLSLYHDRILKDSYGEEKYVYNLALRVSGAIVDFNKLHSRNEFLSWDKNYEMTIDDLHFASGFLQWYVAYQAKEVLSDQEFRSLGWNSLSSEFMTSIPENELNMRYFVFEGAPITKYGLYLALID